MWNAVGEAVVRQRWPLQDAWTAWMNRARCAWLRSRAERARMRAPERSPLWRRAARHVLWSKRGVSKTGTIWLPVSVMLLSQAEPRLRGAWVACLLLFAASVCRTQALILANDLADRAEDRAAGKDRWIAGLPLPVGVAVSFLLLATGAGLLIPAPSSARVLGVYLAAAVLGLLYSLRPVRFKERGLAGLVAYSVSCATAYVLVPWSWLGGSRQGLVLLLCAVFLDRWVNLHFHQVIDHAADAGAACRTYAVRAGVGHARRTLRRAAVLASLSLVAVLLVLAVPLRLPVVAAAGLAAAVLAMVRSVAVRKTAPPLSLEHELPAHYLGLTFAVFRLLPVLLLARLALVAPALWVVAGAAALTALLEARLALRYRYR